MSCCGICDLVIDKGLGAIGVINNWGNKRPAFKADLLRCESVYFFPLERKTRTSCGIPPVILPHVLYVI